MALSTPARLLVSMEQAGRVRLIGATGDVDLATSPALDQAIRLRRGERVDLIVDLTRATFLDCSGARVLFDADGAQREAGRGFSIVHRADDVVARMLGVMAVAGMTVPVFPSRAAAVAALGPPTRRRARGRPGARA